MKKDKLQILAEQQQILRDDFKTLVLNEEDSGYKKFMDYIRKKMDDTMRVPESALYKHDDTNSPLMKYCQPGMTVNLEKFLDNKEDK